MGWYDSVIVEPGRAPTLWLLIGFVLTFAITRGVTRRIRAREHAVASGEAEPSEGGMISNIHLGGVHVHHQVWGILLVLVTGVLQFRYAPSSPWVEVLAALFGAGAALALDEFALWLHLEDVYWSAEGRKSIDAILIASVLALALLLGTSPVGVDPEDAGSWWAFAITLALHFAFVILSALKGKRITALIGVVVPAVASIAAIRLAKPTSFWARRRYGEAKMARARRRYSEQYQARWDRVRDRIGGRHGTRLGAAVDRRVHDGIVHATRDDAPVTPADRGPGTAGPGASG
ncbi:hypothetical protein QQX09_03725 [Demequina sp. SYSU T00192]|uniref:Integral membrane protein n=1 Tax=Demequina litoralis TaxID=3051660 RepID=A0ABT8G757_9MICO|nr:hypothetical protein [Demequina sp. SYSU T00192]MDN4474963.1 hypothetical protein [Demequina sp. SYSU T00192]